jgi:nucleotide-binding universal stress UspA family protein
MTSALPTSEGANVVVPKTIIVPLDGSRFSEGAVPIAREIAGRVGSHVLLMATHFDDVDLKRRMKYLAGVADRVAGDSVGLISINEHPNALVIEELLHDDPDRIVCMRSHGFGRVLWAVLGSVAEQVVRESRRPMLLVGRHCPDRWPSEMRHMVVCVDGSTVADPVVPVAIQWAKALGLDVHVALVVHPLDFEGTGFPDEVMDAIAARFIAEGVEAVPVVLRGAHIAGAIADYVTDLQIALVAMNTHARGGVARAALGSVAMGTVGLVECPGLLVPMAADRQG